MVLKNQRKRDRIKTSGLAKKKIKSTYNGAKKDNYKKKTSKMEDCSICYSSVIVCNDNTVMCGKTSHTICGECKVKMKDLDCPMCRSHSVKQPISQKMFLIIQKKVKKKGYGFEPQDCLLVVSPKQSRAYRRSGMYNETFGTNTNRLVRQRANHNLYFNQNLTVGSSLPVMISMEPGYGEEYIRWLTDDEALRYNGFIHQDQLLSPRYLNDMSSDSLSISSDDSLRTLILSESESDFSDISDSESESDFSDISDI